MPPPPIDLALHPASDLALAQPGGDGAGPACEEFVFGFSTGHTGTTSLSDRDTFSSGLSRPLSDVAFFFEVGGAQRNTADVREQERHVRNVYLPSLAAGLETKRDHGLLRKHGPVPLCVDLSHWDLFFYRGLIRTMEVGRKSFRFVRIRRDAIEIARSLAENTQLSTHDLHYHKKFHTVTGFDPFEARDAIVLGVGEAAWANLSAVQQGIWMADETEAQWRRYVPTQVRRRALEVSWSKYDGGAWFGSSPFVSEAAAPVARALGLAVSHQVSDTKTHAETETANERTANVRELEVYRSIMHTSCAGFREFADLPSSGALNLRYAAAAAEEEEERQQRRRQRQG